MRPHTYLIVIGSLATVALITMAPRSNIATVLLVAAILTTAVGFVITLVNADTRQAITVSLTSLDATFGILLNVGIALLFNLGLTLLILWARGQFADKPDDYDKALLQYLSVGFVAGAVGFSELIGRYRDNPGRLLQLTPTGIYVWINVAAGLFALALVQQFDVLRVASDQPGAADANKNLAIKEALLAAFGAIAFFRTSFFTTKVGDKDIGIGPSALLKAFLETCDREVNRVQAVARAKVIEECMKDVDFKKAKSALPSLCLVLFEGLDANEQQALGEQVKKLDEDMTMPPETKARILGVHLLRQVGSEVVRQAVQALGDKITYDKPPPAAPPLAQTPAPTP